MPTPKRALPRRVRGTASPRNGKLGGVGTAAVEKATGKTWDQWIALLDREQAATQPHKEIATRLRERHGLSGWWAQMVTVGYEQAKGRRVVGQTCAGDFAANASKTLPLSPAQTHAWFTDPRKRHRWLERSVTLRGNTPARSARLQFPDGSIAAAWLTAKGAAKCSVGISHDHLPDLKTATRHKAFWAAALARLAQLAVS